VEFALKSSEIVVRSAMLPSATRDAISALLTEGRSPNTTRTYQAALKYWIGWHRRRYGTTLPVFNDPPDAVPPETILQFIVDHVQRSTTDGLKHELTDELEQRLIHDGVKRVAGAPTLNTTLLRIAVLAKVHSLKALPNPVEDGAVRELLKGVRRAYAARGQRARPKKALPKALLQALLGTCDNSLVGVRDRALLLFAWSSGGRRRSELAAALIDNLERLEDGRFIYRLLHSKTNQTGEVDENTPKPIVGAAALALDAWLSKAQITSGPIFRSIRGDNVGKSLTAHSVALIVKARSAAAGLEGDFSGHSLRSGFITEAGLQGKPIADVMRLSGHRSIPQAMAYYQSGDVLNSSVADLIAGTGVNPTDNDS